MSIQSSINNANMFKRQENMMQVPVQAIPSYPIRFFNISWALVCISVISVVAWNYVVTSLSFRKIPPARYLTCAILIYAFGIIFTETTIRVGLRPNINQRECDDLNISTMGLYLTFELFVYLYFVEKTYVVQRDNGPRLKSWLYILNFVLILGIYVGLGVIQFIYHTSTINGQECVLYRAKGAVVSLLCFSVAALIYLTGLFLLPIARVTTPPIESPTDSVIKKLRDIAFRIFIGSVIILLTISINRIVHVILNGSPIWRSINMDITVVTIVAVTLSWISMEDHGGRSSQAADNYTRRWERRPSRSVRTVMNNLDWMATAQSIQDFTGPQRNLSGSSTVVTNIQAAGGYKIPPPNDNVIAVETQHCTQYESAANSPAQSPQSSRKPSIMKSQSFSHPELPTSLDEMLDEMLSAQQDGDAISPRNTMHHKANDPEKAGGDETDI